MSFGACPALPLHHEIWKYHQVLAKCILSHYRILKCSLYAAVVAIMLVSPLPEELSWMTRYSMLEEPVHKK